MKRINETNATSNWLKVGISASILALSACGGGGGSDSTSGSAAAPAPVVESQDFAPDATKLVNEAETSGELYVETDFRFNNTTTYVVRLSATREDGTPVGNTLVNLYRVPGSDAAMDEVSQENAEHIAIGQTNQFGEFERSIEIAEADTAILASINVVGAENQVVISTDSAENAVITYHFTQL